MRSKLGLGLTRTDWISLAILTLFGGILGACLFVGAAVLVEIVKFAVPLLGAVWSSISTGTGYMAVAAASGAVLLFVLSLAEVTGVFRR